ELAEAEQFSDAGRATRAREEMELLTEHLAGAVGLGGRDRLAASDAERARSGVTQNIRAAIRRIRPRLPALADQLQRHIKTGTYCAYAPGPAPPMDGGGSRSPARPGLSGRVGAGTVAPVRGALQLCGRGAASPQ